jgi:CheY-like chemotaxis protein
VRGAIQNTGDQPIDILISDIGLPDGSGLEIMRHFRHRGRPGHGQGQVGDGGHGEGEGNGGDGHGGGGPPAPGMVRGIALSGFGMEEDIRRSREAGFEHHLTKPVTFDRLRAVLKQIEGGRT